MKKLIFFLSVTLICLSISSNVFGQNKGSNRKSTKSSSNKTKRKVVEKDAYYYLEQFLKVTDVIDNYFLVEPLPTANYASSEISLPPKVELLPESLKSQVEYIRWAYVKWGSYYSSLASPIQKTLTYEEYSRQKQLKQATIYALLNSLSRDYDINADNLEQGLNRLRDKIIDAKAKLREDIKNNSQNSKDSKTPEPTQKLENTEVTNTVQQKADEVFAKSNSASPIGKWKLQVFSAYSASISPIEFFIEQNGNDYLYILKLPDSSTLSVPIMKQNDNKYSVEISLPLPNSTQTVRCKFVFDNFSSDSNNGTVFVKDNNNYIYYGTLQINRIF